MSRRETGGFFAARITERGGDVYDSQTKLKTVGKGQKTCPQRVLQLRGRQLPFA